MPDGDLDITANIPGVLVGSGSGDMEYDTGYTIGGAVGYMKEKFRLEGELSYQANDMDKVVGPGGSEPVNGDVSALTLLFNLYYDFKTRGSWTPYITAGFGSSKVDADIEWLSEDDYVFTYQFGAGVGYAMSETATLDFRYRYLGASDFEYGEIQPGLGSASIEAAIASHNLTIGLRFAF